jgi:hypothetical protein
MVVKTFVCYFAVKRVGHEAKMQRENAPETSAGLVACVESGAGYLSNADRFHSDTSGEEYQLRMEQYRKKEAAIQFRKNQVNLNSTNLIFHSMVSSFRLEPSQGRGQMEGD